ncbi:MAG TPA: tetratricopeptide repeat protein [Blastocatellia bacterium]
MTDRKKSALIELKLKEAVRRSPASFETNHNLGEFYIQQGKLNAAIPYLEKAQRLNPEHYVNSYDLAMALFQTGALARARAQIQSVIKWKDTAELRSLLGDVEDKAGNPVAAAEEYQRAARMEENEERLLDLGNSLIKINAYDAAAQIFDYSLKKYPRSAKLRIGLGIADYSRGQYDDAVRLLCEASDLEPSDPRPYLFLGEMYGVSAEMADDVTRRMARFVKNHPKNALAHYYYAVNLRWGRRDSGSQPSSQVNHAQVETLLKTAIALDPKLPQAHFELGVLYAEQSQYAEAITAFRNAVRLNPEMGKAHYRLALIYQRAGQKEMAAREMEIYRRLKDREADAGNQKKIVP